MALLNSLRLTRMNCPGAVSVTRTPASDARIVTTISIVIGVLSKSADHIYVIQLLGIGLRNVMFMCQTKRNRQKILPSI